MAEAGAEVAEAGAEAAGRPIDAGRHGREPIAFADLVDQGRSLGRYPWPRRSHIEVEDEAAAGAGRGPGSDEGTARNGGTDP